MSNFSTVRISNYKLIKTSLSKVVIFRFVIYAKSSSRYTKSADIVVLSTVYKQVLQVLTEKYKQC
jgi:predicted dinucleotide-binding enzyme